MLNDMGPEINPARGRAHPFLPAGRRASTASANWKPICGRSTCPTASSPIRNGGRMTETSVRRLPGRRRHDALHPNMVMQFIHHPDDNLQWEQWKKIDCPILCLRGESSDLC